MYLREYTYVEVRLPDGGTWRIPAAIIADTYAATMADGLVETPQTQEWADAYRLEFEDIMESDGLLLLWSLQPEWEHFLAWATIVRLPAGMTRERFQAIWRTAERSIVREWKHVTTH